MRAARSNESTSKNKMYALKYVLSVYACENAFVKIVKLTNIIHTEILTFNKKKTSSYTA